MAGFKEREEVKCGCNETANWTNRPFCRSNTQSEPEDVSACPCNSSEEEEEPECLRCCTDYYHSSKRASAELKNDDRARPNYLLGGIAPCEYNNSLEREDGGARPAARWDSDSESTEGEHDGVMERHQSVVGELVEGFRLILFIAMPMLARQIGSIISRRVLTRVFGRNVY